MMIMKIMMIQLFLSAFIEQLTFIELFSTKTNNQLIIIDELDGFLGLVEVSHELAFWKKYLRCHSIICHSEELRFISAQRGDHLVTN